VIAVRRAVCVVLVIAAACSRFSRSTEDAAPPTPLPVLPPRPAGSARVIERAVAPTEVTGLAKLRHKPLVMLEERNPWLTVVGSDEPLLVVYDDGLVLHQRDGSMIEAHVPPAEVAALAHDLVAAGFDALASRYDCSQGTDQPTTTMLVRDGTRWKSTAARGVARSHPAAMPPPSAFVSAYEKTMAYEPPGKPWVPEEIEIMLWPSYATSADPWPAGVPAPPKGIAAPAGGIYAHYVAGKHEAAMRAFLAGPPRRTDVALDDHVWSIGIRRCLPAESYLERVRRCLNALARVDASSPAECKPD
jgi:hypothetical protein